jgi:TATA-box binding protein (TBP) (component of TFIID and TFIIIB)
MDTVDGNIIPVSTKTIIGYSNLNVDILELYNNLPIKEYIQKEKKRGRKKKEVEEDPNKNIPNGSIITLKFEDNFRGVNLKKTKRSKNNLKYFRNALTVIMKVNNDKYLNFKISKNGKFQITGAKSVDQSIEALSYFWNNIKSLDKYKDLETFEIYLLTVMTNIDFNIGFEVDREKLDMYMNEDKRFNSLLEASFGYTGVNIKFPVNNVEPEIIHIKFNREDNEPTYIESPNWDSFIKKIDKKDGDKMISKKRYSTFLVFHSGEVIMSGMNIKMMKPHFDTFSTMIKESRHIIEEKLDL